ncbi:MAG TPA: cytochrome P450 [Acetobacteraceae bacterium]|nr:cytochrome P450 [Acetobacteraceae bacterium]
MPSRLPVIGNLHQVPRGRFMQHLLAVSRAHDGIFQMDFGGRIGIFVCSADFAAELCDEKRFRKVIGAGLGKVRDFGGDGLFTAHGTEPNWEKAHRVLIPAFSMRAMRGYFPMMLEVADQLVAKWRLHENQDLWVADDMTRLTLDTISLAGFGYNFNSFASERMHPFLESMGRALSEAMASLTRLPFMKHLPNRAREARYADDVAAMFKLVDDVIAERRAHPTDGNDLLNLMLTAVDPQTKTRLEDVNIRYQVITFLIAGHETTSGLLSFALYLLLRNPAVLAQAYAEVDRVLGTAEPEYAMIAELTVIDRILKETLRLWPTAPAITVGAYEDTVIGGKYPIAKDYPVQLLILALHRDPQAWENPERFDIDRFLPEREAACHPHAYKPFGNGVRACIGRQFALVEAKLALALLLRNFALEDAEDYQLTVKETLTLKPENFRIRVRSRRAHERLVSGTASPRQDGAGGAVAKQVQGEGQNLVILYGTSLGTCRDIADQIAERATAGGFAVSQGALDDLADGLPEAGLLLVVTSTYNGRAPDNAARLEAAIASGALVSLRRPNLRYAVLGCGNTQWRETYQAFPKLVEQTIAGTGASAIVPRGEADADKDFDAALDQWLKLLWAALGDTQIAAAPRLSATIVDRAELRARAMPASAVALEVLGNEELVRDATGLWDFATEAPRASTRHIRVRLPAGTQYATGDHIAVYARNRPELVEQLLQALKLSPDAVLILQGQGARLRHLPLGTPVTTQQLLGDFVELQDPATRNDVRALMAAATAAATRGALAALVEDSDVARAAFAAEIAGKRVTVPDLLHAYPDIALTLEGLLDLCAAIRPRFYSISSTPLENPGEATLTVGTLDSPAWSGIGQYRGFASSYLMSVRAGDTILGYVRRPNPAFAPPADQRLPMILIGPGTGVAPFRGFLRERAAQQKAGLPIGRTHLFYGCRHPDHDFFYRDELEALAGAGVVSLHLAFSSLEGHPHRFVQDALLARAECVWEALEEGAPIYVCGDGRFMAPAVRASLIEICQARQGLDHDAASAWLESLIQSGLYHQDVFGN